MRQGQDRLTRQQEPESRDAVKQWENSKALHGCGIKPISPSLSCVLITSRYNLSSIKLSSRSNTSHRSTNAGCQSTPFHQLCNAFRNIRLPWNIVASAVIV